MSPVFSPLRSFFIGFAPPTGSLVADRRSRRAPPLSPPASLCGAAAFLFAAREQRIFSRVRFAHLGLLAAIATLAGAVPKPTPLPPGEALLASDTVLAFSPHLSKGENAARITVVDTEDPGGDHAWRVDTFTDEISPWDVDLRASVPRAVKYGDVGMIRFFARACETSDETGMGRMLLGIQNLARGTAGSSYMGDFPLTREWQEILVPFVWLHDHARGEASVAMRFGFKRQSVEIAGITALHYGRLQELAALPQTRYSYAGREPGAPWRQAALDRIERIRKGGIRVQVTDARGQPVKWAAVAITQTRSAFQWGTALDMQRLVVDTPENLRYRQIALELFNSASTHNDLKWPAWERDGREISRAQTLQGLHWLRDHGLYARGHVLVWPRRKHFPSAVAALYNTPRQAELPEIVLTHIRTITRATKGLLDEWDVLNEPYTNHELMDFFGDEIMVSWFKAAREELPHAKLYLNDFSNDDISTDPEHVAHFERTIRFLLDRGAPLDGLGLQGHFASRPNRPENILATLDRYQKEFNLPVRFTEFDMPAGDEQLQADFTRDFLILAYSHPSVVGVQHWGFWEGRHWKPPAAMYRTDWSEKPNAKVYKELVLHQWRTALSSTTDADGRCAARGFYGDYRVTVTADGRSVEKMFTHQPNEAPVWRIELAR